MIVICSFIFVDRINCFKICFLSCFLNLFFFINNEKLAYSFSAQNKFNNCVSLFIVEMHEKSVLVFSLNNYSAKINISRLVLTSFYLNRIRN